MEVEVGGGFGNGPEKKLTLFFSCWIGVKLQSWQDAALKEGALLGTSRQQVKPP